MKTIYTRTRWIPRWKVNEQSVPLCQQLGRVRAHAIKSTSRWSIKVEFCVPTTGNSITPCCVVRTGKKGSNDVQLSGRVTRGGTWPEKHVRWTFFWWADSSKTTTRSSRAVPDSRDTGAWPLHHSNVKNLRKVARWWGAINGCARAH